jgi:hypothetical protein
MQREYTTRRQFVFGTTALAATLAGCSGDGGSNGGGSTPTPAPDGASSDGRASNDGGGSTPNDSPDPDCSRLSGTPTGYDASGTALVFTFDYVDSWERQQPAAGPDALVQQLTSPLVSVDGATQQAVVQIIQMHQPFTEDEAAENVSQATEGESATLDVVHEQEFDGETVRVLGDSGADIPTYVVWLPHGSGGDRSYYRVQLNLLSTIARTNETEAEQQLCLEESLAGIETIRESLTPNPESTIEEV